MKPTKFLILPLFVYAIIVWIMASRRTWEIELLNNHYIFSDTSFIKLILTIVIPLLLIISIKDLKATSGVYFGQTKNSLLIAWTSFYLVGPACIGFLIVGLLGWSFKDWYGTLTLSAIFLIALYFIPKITTSLSTHDEKEKRSLKLIFILIGLSLIATITSIIVENKDSILLKTLYFFFIVAVGEELLFRGYLQTSFNLFFGRKFRIGNVDFGWGLILTSVLFGLIHSLAATPIVWPWMLFTFVGGLILGYVREKDGSLLAPIMLHALMDFPLIFMT